MFGIIELIIVLIVVALIIGFLGRRKFGVSSSRNSKAQKSFRSAKKVIFAVLGISLIGLVVVNSLRDINDLARDEAFKGKMSAPSMKPVNILSDANVTDFRVLTQLLILDQLTQKIILVHEKILDNKSRKFSEKFDFKNYSVEFTIEINEISKWGIGKERILGEYSIRSNANLGTHYSSGGLNHETGSKFERENRVNLNGSMSFFTLPENSDKKLSIYILTHRLHPDDQLLQVKGDEIVKKLSIDESLTYKSSVDKSKELPFIVLMESLGVCSLVLLLGVFLVSRAIDISFAFPILLALTILTVIGIKKYELSVCESIALNSDSESMLKKNAIYKATKNPFFKESAKGLIGEVKESR